MPSKENLFSHRFTRSFGITSYVLLTACFFLGAYAVIALTAQSAGRPIDEEGLILRSKAVESGPSLFGELPPMKILIVTCVVGTLVIANALAEAKSDSLLGEIKRQFSGLHAEHLFLPVAIQTSEREIADGYLVRLSKHRASFFAPQAINLGSKIAFRSNAEIGSNQQQSWFHGIVTGSRGDIESKRLEIEIRLHAETKAEKANLSHWITSLAPTMAVTS